MSVIPEDIYKKLASSVTLQKAYKKLYSPCKMILNCTGKFLAVLQHNQQSCYGEIYVVAGLEQSLLGRNACHKLGIISRMSAVKSSISRNTYEEKFPKLFRELGCIEGDHEIKLDENVKPYNLTTPRHIPIPLLHKIKSQI